MAEKPVPSLLRHFSAPVELQYNYTNEELAQLLQKEVMRLMEALQQKSN